MSAAGWALFLVGSAGACWTLIAIGLVLWLSVTDWRVRRAAAALARKPPARRRPFPAPAHGLGPAVDRWHDGPLLSQAETKRLLDDVLERRPHFGAPRRDW